MTPLADKIRPTSLDDVAGQEHLIGKNGVLRRIINSGDVPNMIFYGPPGIGKTTIANIIASMTDKKLHCLNATTSGTGDIKDIIATLDTFETKNGVLLYLDEIQHFNKKQQQTLLEYMENGKITLIASTTENPYFYVYPAILSRSTVFEFKPLNANDMAKVVRRALYLCNMEADEDVVMHVAAASGGDVRKAVNAVELLSLITLVGKPTLDDARAVTQRSAMRYDRDGDSHYDLLSAFQKSIRGSDPDAAVFYLAKLIAGGDLPSICRRVLVIAAEDIGLAYPQAIPIVKACVDSALQLGIPEARIPLADAVILLATAPKSNSGICAIDAALEAVNDGRGVKVPANLQDSHYGGAKVLEHGLGYKYPHAYPNAWVKQQYLPDDIKDVHFYQYGQNKTEQAYKEYWKKIKSES